MFVVSIVPSIADVQGQVFEGDVFDELVLSFGEAHPANAFRVIAPGHEFVRHEQVVSFESTCRAHEVLMVFPAGLYRELIGMCYGHEAPSSFLRASS